MIDHRLKIDNIEIVRLRADPVGPPLGKFRESG